MHFHGGTTIYFTIYLFYILYSYIQLVLVRLFFKRSRKIPFWMELNDYLGACRLCQKHQWKSEMLIAWPSSQMLVNLIFCHYAQPLSCQLDPRNGGLAGNEAECLASHLASYPAVLRGWCETWLTPQVATCPDSFSVQSKGFLKLCCYSGS